MLRFEHIGSGVAVLTLSRPGSLNALDAQLVGELYAACADLAADRDTRAVVLTGDGRAFSAGQDIKDFGAPVPTPADGAEAMLSFQQRMSGLVNALRAVPQPVVAAVNGVAVGGGMALACASDIRLAAPAARFGTGAIKLGLSGCEMGLSYLLPRLVGLGAAAEWMLTGRLVEADEARAAGLVNRVVPAEDLLASAVTLAEQIAANAPYGVRATKQVMWANVDAASLEEAQAVENDVQVAGALTEDAAEAKAALLERRPPRFTNR